MHTFHIPPRARVEGVAFAVPELLLLSAWAEFHAFNMSIELDWHVDHVEYEEVVTLSEAGRTSPHWLLWRSPTEIVLQPTVGRAQRFTAIVDALEAICPESV